MDTVIVTLAQNAAMLLAMMVVFDLATNRTLEHEHWRRQVLAGGILGALCIGLMIVAFRLENGLIFDTRSVLLSLSGLFLGAIPTVVAMLIAAVYRLWQGGIGAWPGIGVILATGGIGILWRLYRSGRLVDISVRELYGFGVAVHLVMLAMMLMLPWEVALQVISGVGLPVLLVFPLVTITLGWLLANRLQREGATDALAASEERFRSVFESANVGKSITRLTGEIDVNQAFCDMLGYRPEELRGKTWQELVPKEEISSTNELMVSLIKGEQNHVRFEKRYLHKNGSTVWADFSAALVRDSEQNPLYYIVTVVNISERKRAEELNQESVTRFQIAQDLTPDGFTILQPVRSNTAEIIDFAWIYENAAIARINGTDPQKVIGKRLLELFPEHRGTALFDTYLDVANTGETRVIEEIGVQDILSKPMWLRLVIVSMGTNIAIQTENITERKLAEQALRLQAQRSEALLMLPKLADDYDEKVFMQRGMELVEQLTGSKISFIHFIKEGGEEIELVAWSRSTLEHYCTAAHDSHYPVGKAGIWADALRQGKPVIFNDYPNYPHKKGLPEGHSALERLISVPVIENDRVVLLAGVGNKDKDYTDFDVESVQLIVTVIWQIVKEARMAESARVASARLASLVNHVPGMLYQYKLRADGTSCFPYASHGIQAIYGVLPAEVVDDAAAVFKVLHPEDVEHVTESIQQSARTLTVWHDQYRVNLPQGRTIWVEGEATPEVSQVGEIIWHGYIRDITEKKESVASLVLANSQLRASETRLQESINGIIHLLSITVEARDPYTAGHQHRVSRLSSAIAQEMGLPEDAIEGVRLAAEIHDLGKIAVPAEILSKPMGLNSIEFELVKRHAQVGYDILKEIKFPWPIAETVYQHHERMDGSGYPRGLKGEQILLEARIVCVADVVEAMSSFRPYRSGLGVDAALAEIERNRGILYDAAVVDACLRLFREQGFEIKV